MNRVVDLVVSGAGALGATEAACMEELSRGGVVFRRVGGASAGSINSAGEALGLGHKLSKLWVEMLSSGRLEDYKLPGPLKFAGVLIGPGHGLISGKAIRSVLAREFGKACMGDVEKPLRVKVTNLSRRRAQTVSSDNDEHKKLRVVDVVMCSLAVPFVIDAQQLDPSSPVLYSDGGIADNVPRRMWDDDESAPTLTISFKRDETARKVSGLRDMISAVLDVVRDAAEDATSNKPTRLIAELELPAFGNALDFSQTITSAEAMVRAGTFAARSWLANPRDILGRSLR